MNSFFELSLIKEQFLGDMEFLDIDSNWSQKDKEADINWWKEKFEVIEKDLKILKILKRNLYVEKGTGNFKGIEIIQSSLGNQHSEDFNAVKEWLENE